MVGKPVVRGTRIPVELILEQFAFNLDLDDLFGAPRTDYRRYQGLPALRPKLVQHDQADMRTSPEATRASA